MKNTTKTPKGKFFITTPTRSTTRKTTTSQPSIQPLRYGEITKMVSDILSTTPKASSTEVYASMLRKMGVSLRNTSLEMYLRRHSTYPKYASVEKIYTTIKRNVTAAPAPIVPSTSGQTKKVVVRVNRSQS